MISKAQMLSGVQLEDGGWVSPLALASAHGRVGINKRNCPQAFSTLKLSTNRRELRKSMIPEGEKFKLLTPAFKAPVQRCSLLP